MVEDNCCVDEQTYWKEPVLVSLVHIEQGGEGAGMEQDKGGGQEKGDLVQPVFCQAPALGKILKG